MPAGQGARWLRLEGWGSVSPDASPPSWKPPARRRRETIRRWRQTWGPHDDRLVWLTTLLTVVEHPARAADPRLPGSIAFALKTIPGVSPSQGVGPERQDRRPEAIGSRYGLPEEGAGRIITHASSDRRQAGERRTEALRGQTLDPRRFRTAGHASRPIRRAGGRENHSSVTGNGARWNAGRARAAVRHQTPLGRVPCVHAAAGLLFVLQSSSSGFAAFLRSPVSHTVSHPPALVHRSTSRSAVGRSPGARVSRRARRRRRSGAATTR